MAKRNTIKEGVKKNTMKVKSKTSSSKKSKPIKVLVAHNNRLGYSTTKAHKFAERIDKNKDYKVIYDKDHWNLGEKTSPTEINKREKEMVQKADVVTRIIHSPSKTGQKRHNGALSEERKAIRSSKPIIEIYERGAHESPNRSITEKNYTKKIKINLKEGETLDKGFKSGVEKLKKKRLL